MAGVQNAVADDVDGDGEEEEEEEVNGRQFRKPITAEVGRVGGAARLVAAEVERTLRTRSRRDVFGVDAGAARLSRETRTTPPSPSLHRRSRTTDRFRRVFWGGFSVRRRVEEDGSANERCECTLHCLLLSICACTTTPDRIVLAVVLCRRPYGTHTYIIFLFFCLSYLGIL